jgi:hypothetical protein
LLSLALDGGMAKRRVRAALANPFYMSDKVELWFSMTACFDSRCRQERAKGWRTKTLARWWKFERKPMNLIKLSQIRSDKTTEFTIGERRIATGLG